jgi:hypothetical protein
MFALKSAVEGKSALLGRAAMSANDPKRTKRQIAAEQAHRQLTKYVIPKLPYSELPSDVFPGCCPERGAQSANW